MEVMLTMVPLALMRSGANAWVTASVPQRTEVDVEGFVDGGVQYGREVAAAGIVHQVIKCVPVH